MRKMLLILTIATIRCVEPPTIEEIKKFNEKNIEVQPIIRDSLWYKGEWSCRAISERDTTKRFNESWLFTPNQDGFGFAVSVKNGYYVKKGYNVHFSEMMLSFSSMNFEDKRVVGILKRSGEHDLVGEIKDSNTNEKWSILLIKK